MALNQIVRDATRLVVMGLAVWTQATLLSLVNQYDIPPDLILSSLMPKTILVM